MDGQTAKKLSDLQEQINTIVTRKRKRGYDDLQDQIEDLRWQLASSTKRCREINPTNRTLKGENEKFKKKLKQQEDSQCAIEETLRKRIRFDQTIIESLRDEIGEQEEERIKLKFKLEKLEAREAASRKILLTFKEKLNETLSAVSVVEETSLPCESKLQMHRQTIGFCV